VTALVIEASVLVSLWLDLGDSPTISRRLEGTTLHAADHLFVEAVNVLRRRRNTGHLDRAAAETAFAGVTAAPIRRWPFALVSERMRELGPDVSTCDPAYVARAERLRAPLLTRDVKLSRVPGMRCDIEIC
jgi:predicted nucleic acid-binding protein